MYLYILHILVKMMLVDLLLFLFKDLRAGRSESVFCVEVKSFETP